MATRQAFCLFSTYNAVSIAFGKARVGRTGPSRIITSNSPLHCGADRVHLSTRGQWSVMIDRGDDHVHLGSSGPSDRRTGSQRRSNIDDLLTETRKYKLGCVFAHQHLDQCAPSLRASFAANTAIKMAAGVSTADARAMAPDMRTTPDFILGQPRLHFACHIRNVTPQAVSIPVEAGKLEDEPRLSPRAYERFRADNRKRVSLGEEEKREATSATAANPRNAEAARPSAAPGREAPSDGPPPINADDDYQL